MSSYIEPPVWLKITSANLPVYPSTHEYVPPIDWAEWSPWVKEHYGKMSHAAMTEYIGCMPDTLRKAIKRLQAKGELPVLMLPTSKGRLTPEQLEEIQRLHESGVSQKAIAQRMHVHCETIRYHLRRGTA